MIKNLLTALVNFLISVLFGGHFIYITIVKNSGWHTLNLGAFISIAGFLVGCIFFAIGTARLILILTGNKSYYYSTHNEILRIRTDIEQTRREK